MMGSDIFEDTPESTPTTSHPTPAKVNEVNTTQKTTVCYIRIY